MTTPYEDFVNIALGKALSSDVTLPTADEIPVFTGIGRQVTGKTKAELGLALTTDLGTAAAADVGDFDPAGSAATALSSANTYADNNKQAKDATLTALAAFNSNGSLHQTSADTFVARTLTGTASQITVTNGDGVAGNPTISLPASGVTANTYGSASAIPVVTVNAQGVVTLVTTAAVASPAVFSDSDFRIQDNDDANKLLAFELSGIVVSPAATPTVKTITMPNANVNLGTMSSVATTDSNTLSGTHNRILGGSSNNVSGTDNVAIGCTGYTLSTGNQVAIGAGYEAGNAMELITCSDTLVTGGVRGYQITALHRLRALNGVFVAETPSAPLSATLGLTNTPKAILRRSTFLNARHELTFTATVYSSVGVKAGTISGVRVFGVHYKVGSTLDDITDYTVTSLTPYADLVDGNCSAVITASIVEVAITKEKLLSISIQPKNASGTADYLGNCLAELTSHYRFI